MKCLPGDFPLSVGSVLLTGSWQGNSSSDRRGFMRQKVDHGAKSSHVTEHHMLQNRHSLRGGGG